MARRFVSILLVYALVLQLFCSCVPAVLTQKPKERIAHNPSANIARSAQNQSEKAASASEKTPVSSDSFAGNDVSNNNSSQRESLFASWLHNLDIEAQEQNQYYIDNASSSETVISRTERTSSAAPGFLADCPAAPIYQSSNNNSSLHISPRTSLFQVRIQYNRPLLI